MVVVFLTAIVFGGGRVQADFTFGESVNLGATFNTPYWDLCPNISADGLTLYFSSARSSGSGQDDLWVSRRPTRNDPWGEPVNLGATVNSSSQEWFSCISQDGLSLYFCSNRPGGSGGWDLWMTMRGTTEEDWELPLNLGQTVNSSADEFQPHISADGCTLLLCSTRPGGYGDLDIWITKRDTKNDPWGAPLNLGPPVNSSVDDGRPSMSSDGRHLFFRSNRLGGFGDADIWLTTRATTNASWGEPINLGPRVNTFSWECGPCISRDGSTLYFHSYGPSGYGGFDLWQASVIPIVDFNGDHRVDIEDLMILIEHWNQNGPLCDIGPTPLGDGVVDAADLEVLMSHWGQEVDDPTLRACWKLDETEGDIAYDSASVNDAMVKGEALWQPDRGMIDGALAFDGVDDYVSTPFALNPADGEFSVFVWIKGGAPGQVILSQENSVFDWIRGGAPDQVILSQDNSAHWLLADTAAGALRTDISDPVQQSRRGSVGGDSLISQTVITDGNWHHVGLVWDGTNRILYVDDVVVAEDALPKLAPASGVLHIGAAADLEEGTFWSGLIDDVRIHTRVVVP